MVNPRTTQSMYTRQEIGRKIDLGNKARRREGERESKTRPSTPSSEPELSRLIMTYC